MGCRHLLSAVISSSVLLTSPALAGEKRELHLERMIIRVNKTRSLEEKIEETPNNPLNLRNRYRYSPQDLERYQSQIDQCINHSQNENFCLLVDKAAHELSFYQNRKKLAAYPIELGRNPYDDKKILGDNCTPEGIYGIKYVLKNSAFYKALYLSYPNLQDQQEFKQLKKQGKIPGKAKIGKNIEIHGSGAERKGDHFDWTMGCIALSNSNMDDLYKKMGLKDYKTMHQKELNEIIKKIKVCIVKYGTKNNY